MRKAIEAAVAALVGLPFRDWCRAADWALFGFGEMHTDQLPRHHC